MRVHKDHDKTGKPVFYARVGDFFGPIKSSSGDALKALSDQLDQYHPLNHTYVIAKNGTVLHVLQTPSHGWNVRIIPPTGYKGKGIGVGGTLQQAITKAREWAERHGDGVAVAE